ncbi:hypothetical protein BDV25DRAFT_131552 [Aspergillus avenaceus]|uniref:RED-like N-terminal domain-containing protein n=1 Tax=Aspergillus avenaceus TaxID=36643 RepID=A0A5N6TNZ5_ASPAV|nr:hypothetical protein BDV25DRAFT_131552 [Aspergillus avenaceus]
MNNNQFRRLLLSPKTQENKSHAQKLENAPNALGSRARSNIPMTPRNVQTDFARQLSEYRRDAQPAKRFKSSAAPKGTRLPSGYTDRALLRESTEGEDGGGDGGDGDVEKRVKALEEMVKLGQVDGETVEKIKAEIGVGGDLKSTHLVKGLDWGLLRRVRAGEDVDSPLEKDKEGNEVDVEGELERLEGVTSGSSVSGVKEKKKKKGNMVVRKSRDDILKELRASRAKPEPALGSRFKKIGEVKEEKKRWVETDERGRRKEILQITDAEGKTKRKARWLDPETETGPEGLLVPEKDAKPLGMEVPAEIAARAVSEEEDDDIFAGVGADYDPLGNLGEEDDSSDSDEDGEVEQPKTVAKTEPSTQAPAKPRNYFSTSTDEPDEPDRGNPLTKDPTLLAALKRAAALRQAGEEGAEGEEDVEKETLLRRKKFLEEARRREQLDAMDMDLGFGSSRVEDEEDDEVILEERGGKKRKRGPKKKKGDKDSVSDVMSVLQGRK